MYGRPIIDYQSLDSENKARVLLSDFRLCEMDIEFAQERINDLKRPIDNDVFFYYLPGITLTSEAIKKRKEEVEKHHQHQLWKYERKLSYAQWLIKYVGGALEFIKSTMPDHYNVLRMVYVEREGFRDEPVKALLSQLGMTPKIYRRIRNEAMQKFLTLCPVDTMPYIDQIEAHYVKLKAGPKRTRKGI